MKMIFSSTHQCPVDQRSRQAKTSPEKPGARKKATLCFWRDAEGIDDWELLGDKSERVKADHYLNKLQILKAHHEITNGNSTKTTLDNTFQSRRKISYRSGGGWPFTVHHSSQALLFDYLVYSSIQRHFSSLHFITCDEVENVADVTDVADMSQISRARAFVTTYKLAKSTNYCKCLAVVIQKYGGRLHFIP